MSKKIAGIQGILGTYVTSQNDAQVAPEANQGTQSPDLDESRSKSQRASNKRARLGRPPGIAKGTSPRKEKATLRIEAELMSDYRDWSWDQRCQLGELVERALADYRRRHR
jgi:uncharacterized protein (DUF4415 family)